MIEATMPQRAQFADEVSYCRAMQKFGACDVKRDDPQRRICIDDWFREEILLGMNLGSPVGAVQADKCAVAGGAA